MTIIRLCCLLLLSLLISCTVQKRKHQSGFYVSWNHKKAEPKMSPSTVTKVHKETPNEAIIPVNNEETVASASTAFITTEQKTSRAVISFTNVECDLIVKRNGEEVQAKVLEVTSTVIRYKRCDLPDGPLYTINKSEVFMVKYPNGSKDVIPEETSRQNLNYNVPAPVSKKNKRLEPLALIGFITSIVSLFMPWASVGLFLCAAAVLLCIIAISKVNARPNELKGKGLAIAGLVIGLIFGALFLLVLSVS